MNRLYFIILLAAAVVLACEKKPSVPEGNKTDQTEPKAVVSPEGCIENDIVYAFMQCGPYEKFGAKTWFKDPVVRATADVYNWKNDHPNGIKVSWDGKADVSVSLSLGGKVVWEDTATGADSYTFSGVIPGVEYTYSVSASGSPVKSGTFTATGQVRMFDIPGSWNWRDIGGWSGLDGRKIRYGWVFRGGSLNGNFIGEDSSADVYDHTKYEWSPEAQKACEYIGIKAELDLRGDPDDPGVNGAEYLKHTGTLRHCQIEGAEYKFIMTDLGYQHPFDRSSVIQGVAWIIHEVKKGNPVAIHCKSGADRTGAIMGVIEGLLGVSEGDVARDYELTSISTELPQRNVRYASEVGSSSYFLSKKKGIFSLEQSTFHDQCYFYLNQYFDDVHINADDLDWFIRFMLQWDGFQRPSYAKNYENNSLESVYSIDTGSGLHTYGL